MPPKEAKSKEVKPKTDIHNRISSGIPGLDKLIGGGFLENDVYLVTGGTGTGKTLLAKAVANESGANFIYIKASELLSMWVGESERGVRKIFDITQRDGRVDVSVQLQFDNGSDMRMARLIARRETDGWSSPSIAFYSNRAHPVEDQISKEEAYINAEEAFGL